MGDRNVSGRINVLFVIWSLELGGAERIVNDLAVGLDRQKYNPLVCCLNNKGIFASGLEMQKIPVIALHKGRGVDIRVLFSLIKVIRKYNIKLINTHLWGANCWGRAAGLLTQVPVIVTEHSVDTWKPRVYRIIDRILGLFTRRMICVSDEVKTFYIHHARLSQNRISVVENGVPVPDDEPEKLPAGITLPDGCPLIGIIGRIAPEKGHFVFLKALQLIVRQIPGCKVVIIGDGVDRSQLETEVERVGFGGIVRFYGTITAGLQSVYKKIDMLVLPSLREGLSLTALEALAAGKPVVATDVGSNRSLICREEHGTLVTADDPRALADGIMAVYRRSDDPDDPAIRREFVCRQYSLEKMINKTEQVFQLMLS